MLRPGFEPESSARKADMIGRTTLPEHTNLLLKPYRKSLSGPNGVRTHGRPVMSRALYLAKLWAQNAADRARTCDQSIDVLQTLLGCGKQYDMPVDALGIGGKNGTSIFCRINRNR